MTTHEDRKEPPATAGRARRVLEEWQHGHGGEPVTVETSAGQVVINHMELQRVGDLDVLEVHVGEPAGGDPHFRIVNPPLNLVNAQGVLSVAPLAALAEVIAGAGGARRSGARRRGSR